MSGDYVNTMAPGRSTMVPRRPPTSNLTPQAVVAPGRPSSVRRRIRRQQQQQQPRRPPSVLGQRISQVYELALDGRPACIHKAAVTPILWLLCQVVLVALFAVCCIFLPSLQPSQAVEARVRKPWMRLEFNETWIRALASINDSSIAYRTTASPYKELICTANGSDYSAHHCDEMKQHFGLVETADKGTAIEIMKDSVYRINAAVTFQRQETNRNPVDVVVLINDQQWILCMEGFSGGYTHCTLFGIRYLTQGTRISFNTSQANRTIAAHKSATFFEIEMR